MQLFPTVLGVSNPAHEASLSPGPRHPLLATGASKPARWDGHINADKEGGVLRVTGPPNDCPAYLVYYPLYGWC